MGHLPVSRRTIDSPTKATACLSESHSGALAPDEDGELRDDSDGAQDGPTSTRRMDVFPEPTGLTAVLPGESARAGRGDSA